MIVNLCAHYRVKLFELLGAKYDIRFLFFSEGERYYDGQRHLGDFNGRYLWGFNIGRHIRINPKLIFELLFTKYDILVKCINSPIPLLFSFVVSKIRRKKFILWTGIWHCPETLFHKFSFPFVKLIYKYSDAILTYGTHVKGYLISLGIDGNKIFVFQKAIDNSLYNKPVLPQQIETLVDDLEIRNKKVILFVGQLKEEKGVDYLIDAFAGLNRQDTVLIMIGRGPLKEHIQSLVTDHKLNGNVMFLDYIENTMLYTYYALADVFVLPSVTTRTFKEPWGMVVNEAMNQGCPVIATDSVGAAVGGMVQNQINGFIVPQRDSSALEKALNIILNDDNIRKQLSANSKKIVGEYTVERKVQGFKNAIDYVLKLNCSREKEYKY